MRGSRAIKSCGSQRRRDAVQTRVRGGCSGGGWPRPSGRESFRWRAMLSEAIRNGWKTLVDMPVKHFDMQAVMKTHLSQSIGAGAFDGQHVMSFAISSAMADGDISSVIACIDAWEGASAITGRETGANASPAIIKIASSRRIAKLRFTALSFSQTGSEEKAPSFNSNWSALIGIKLPTSVSVQITCQPVQSPPSVPISFPADRTCCRSQSRVRRNETRDP